MRPRVLTLLVLLSLGVLIAARPASPTRDTVQQLSQWFQRGVVRIEASVRTGAADLWAAGKSAFATGTK